MILLALLVSAFTYWQVRVPLDGAVRAGGVDAGAARLALALASGSILAAALAFERHMALLRRAPGPEWLALPIEPTQVLAHLRGESRLAAALALVPMAASILAGVGLLPTWVLLLAAAGAVLGWLESTRTACAIAQRFSARRSKSEQSLPTATRLLVDRAIASSPRGRAEASWRARTPASALGALDRLASRRHAPSRTRLIAAGVFALLAVLAWSSGAPPLLRRAQSFIGFMLVAASLGTWAIARAGDLPASFHRPLPIRPRDAWWARATPIAIALTLLAAVAAIAAALTGAAGLGGIAAIWPAPALAAALLGLHHGLTLPSHASTAENLYIGWLGVMLAASWMIPLLGWVVLVAALAHSLRRLPRGTHPESLGC